MWFSLQKQNNLLGEYAGTATVDTICACEGGVDIGTGRNVPLYICWPGNIDIPELEILNVI